MSHNYYVRVAQKRTVDPLYEERLPQVDEVLARFHVKFEDEERKQDFLQDLLNALDVGDMRVVERCSVEHLGKWSGAGTFTFAKTAAEIESYPADAIVDDTYGRTMTMAQFRHQLKTKGKDFRFNSIGKEFS